MGPANRRRAAVTRGAAPAGQVVAWKPRSKSHDPVKWLEESDIDRIPAPYNLLRYLPAFPGKQIVASDCRDWGAIRGWADEIARWFLPGS